jgi:phospholipid/cholesterol/gamma-HCH transport system substrate-binding protein
MSEKKAAIIVGISVIGALAVLVAGLIWGKGVSLFSVRNEYRVRFADVQGLEKGDPVVIRGISCGAVKDIALEPDQVMVLFWVKKSVRLFTDATMSIESRELIGGKQIGLNPGRNEVPAHPDSAFRGDAGADPALLFGTLDRLALQADTVLHRIAGALEKVDVERMSNSAVRTSEEARVTIEENRVDVRKIVERLDRMTAALESDSIMTRFGSFVARWDSTSKALKGLVNRVEAGEGTVGKLVKEKQLYDQLLETTLRMDSLITDVKKNPRKYIHVSVF